MLSLFWSWSGSYSGLGLSLSLSIGLGLKYDVRFIIIIVGTLLGFQLKLKISLWLINLVKIWKTTLLISLHHQ